MNGESQWIALLLASLVRPFVLVAAAGLVLRVFRVRHPASRHAVWSVVLFAMPLLPIVSVLTPHWSLPASPSMEEPPVFLAPELAPEPIQPIQPPQTISLPSQPAPSKMSPSMPIVRFYLAGLFAMLLYRAAGWIMLRRVVARSTPIKGRVLRESADVIAPVAVGVLRPAVILPIGWRDWNAETRRAVLAHEFAHIRRNDTLISALARFTRSVLWFHPLAWWISRRVAELAELACDAVALESLRDPGKYSRILLDFASGVNRAGYRVALPGLAMAASSSGMGRRIDQVFELADGSARKLARPGALLALIGLPVMCLAATVGLRESNTPLQLPPIILPKTPELRIVAQAQKSAAQLLPAPKPKWEVASIRPCEAGGGGRSGGPSVSHGRLNTNCQTVMTLIQQAYVTFANGQSQAPWSVPISGGPAWINSARYEIEAKAEGEPLPHMMEGPMMQALLEDRFKLKVHRETKEVPVYALTVAKGGFKLHPFQEGSCTPRDPAKGPVPIEPGQKPYCGSVAAGGPGLYGVRVSIAEPSTWTLNLAATSMSVFCSNLRLDRPILDKTGITGLFDFHLEYAFDQVTAAGFPGAPAAAAAPDPGAAPSIFTAIQEQLGLKLDPAKGPGDFLVIDSVERPSDN